MSRRSRASGLTVARHERMAELFSRAAGLASAARRAFLDSACASDAALREEIESLLAHDAAAGSPFDSPLLGTGFNLNHVLSADSALDISVPDRVGPYRVLGLLGVGSMGVVYRAQQAAPARVVAIKVMQPGRVSRHLRRRFLDEMESLGRLQHPGIAQIYHAGEEITSAGPQPYMVMQLVEGRPLNAYIAEHPPDLAARIDLLIQICDAVQYAHQRGIIHRDLKPANIIMQEDHAGARPLILDFGVARIMDRGSRDTSAVTQCGQLVGTLAYMSPEQVSGQPDETDTRSDVYALGVIGYELLCGRLPVNVNGMTVLGALQAIREHAPVPLGRHDRKLRGDLSTIFAKALAKNKGERYSSAAALAADLHSFLLHHPIAARPPSAAYVLAKLARRNRLAVAGLALGLCLAAVGFVRARLAQRALQSQYAEARDVASFLAREFTDRLDEIGGTNEVRRDLLERLRAHVERLLQHGSRDAKLQVAHADVLMNLSNVELVSGNRERALALREQVLEARRSAAALAPDDWERQADLSIALVQVGDIHHGSHDWPRARHLYEQALLIDEALVRRNAESHRLCSNLLWSYARVAQLACDQGDSSSAAGWADRAAEIAGRLLTRNPDDIDALHARVYLAQLPMELAGQPAVEYANGVLEEARRLLSRLPLNSIWQRECGGILIEAGIRCVTQENFTLAEELLCTGRTVMESFVLQDPGDAEARHGLSGAYWHSSRAAVGTGDLDKAAALADRACELAEQLFAESPDTVQRQRRLLQVKIQRATVAVKQNDSSMARDCSQRAVELARQLAQDPRVSVADSVYYARILFNPPATDVRDAESARETAERALLATDGQLPLAWDLLIRYYRQCDEPTLACEWFEQALSRLPESETRLREQIEESLYQSIARTADR